MAGVAGALHLDLVDLGQGLIPLHSSLSPPDGPILQAKPKPVSVDVGKDASFSCAWRGNPLPRITWTRLGGSQVESDLGLVTVAGTGQSFLPEACL